MAAPQKLITQKICSKEINEFATKEMMKKEALSILKIYTFLTVRKVYIFILCFALYVYCAIIVVWNTVSSWKFPHS